MQGIAQWLEDWTADSKSPPNVFKTDLLHEYMALHIDTLREECNRMHMQLSKPHLYPIPLE